LESLLFVDVDWPFVLFPFTWNGLSVCLSFLWIGDACFDCFLLSVFSFGASRGWGLFFYSRVFLHGLATNRSSRFRAVSHLRVSGRSGDDALRLAARHSRAHRHANQHG